MILDPEIKQIMVEGTARDRRYICAQRDGGFFYFCMYYFHDYFTYQMADFHYDMIEDLEDILSGKYDFLLWIMFREAAKTVWSRMFVIYCIAYGLKHYINWDSYDSGNGEAAMFDITQSLQTNQLLIADFGNLYYEQRSDKVKTLKRIKSFVTVNGIKVEAFTTQQSTRGRIYKKYRPDLYILDDFETNKTKRSVPVMQKIIDHINELMSGLSPDGDVIFNCNYITEAGVVQNLIERSKNDPRFLKRQVDAETDGKPTWSDKFVMTDKEAEALNPARQAKGEAPKISLESRKRTLNADGQKIYETEMLNSPEASGDLFFDRAIIDRLIEKCKNKKPIKEVAGRMIWSRYNPSHMYGIGADTSKGVSLDSNASVGINFGPERGVSGKAAEQVLSYANNEIAPDEFAHELAAEGRDLGECLIAPEINAESGGTCLNELRHIYPEQRIYRRTSSDKPKLGEKPSFKLGWETTSLTKPQMLFGLRKAVQDEILIINDVRILMEMRKFTQADMSDSATLGSTRHFDLLMACAIAWAMFGNTQLQAQKDNLVSKNLSFKQPDYESVSEFEKPGSPFSNSLTRSSDPFKSGNISEDNRHAQIL